jgi:hypothetical protein
LAVLTMYQVLSIKYFLIFIIFIWYAQNYAKGKI